MEEIEKLIGELAPELATGDVNYHHSILIKMLKIINLQQELLQSLVYLSQTSELKSFFENKYISAYMEEVENFLDSL